MNETGFAEQRTLLARHVIKTDSSVALAKTMLDEIARAMAELKGQAEYAISRWEEAEHGRQKADEAHRLSLLLAVSEMSEIRTTIAELNAQASNASRME